VSTGKADINSILDAVGMKLSRVREDMPTEVQTDCLILNTSRRVPNLVLSSALSKNERVGIRVF
jgi:hypothetical protein